MPTTNPSAARGQTKPFVPKFNPPVLSRTREMVWPELSRRIRASLTIVPLEKLLEATLGESTFKLFKTWTSEIAEQDWLADKDIKDHLKRYCTATPETSRYAPLVALNNRLLEYAQGKLQGVKDQDSYATKDITYAKTSSTEIPKGSGQASRRPDVIMTTTTAQNEILRLKQQMKKARKDVSKAKALLKRAAEEVNKDTMTDANEEAKKAANNAAIKESMENAQKVVDDCLARLEELGWSSVRTWIEVKVGNEKLLDALNNVLATKVAPVAPKVRHLELHVHLHFGLTFPLHFGTFSRARRRLLANGTMRTTLSLADHPPRASRPTKPHPPLRMSVTPTPLWPSRAQDPGNENGQYLRSHS